MAVIGSNWPPYSCPGGRVSHLPSVYCFSSPLLNDQHNQPLPFPVQLFNSWLGVNHEIIWVTHIHGRSPVSWTPEMFTSTSWVEPRFLRKIDSSPHPTDIAHDLGYCSAWNIVQPCIGFTFIPAVSVLAHREQSHFWNKLYGETPEEMIRKFRRRYQYSLKLCPVLARTAYTR
jgi:hypothetical protein